jgi:hypothetical protein
MLYVYFKFGSQNTSMEMVGASTDLFHLDNTRVDAALDAMLLFLHKDAQGGCWGRPRIVEAAIAGLFVTADNCRTMSEAASTRKRKPTEESEAVVVVSDDTLDVGPSVSMNTCASTSAKLVIAEATSDEQSQSASNAQQDESIVSIGRWFKNSFICCKVDATFAALNLDLVKDKRNATDSNGRRLLRPCSPTE